MKIENEVQSHNACKIERFIKGVEKLMQLKDAIEVAEGEH